MDGNKVALYLDSTSNHNFPMLEIFTAMLLYILILHQTTTILSSKIHKLLLLYILILHQTTTMIMRSCFTSSCFISWFYIKPQLRTVHFWAVQCCFISWFYIKPQHSTCCCAKKICCFISWFYIKPQPMRHLIEKLASCFISLFYIKPQLVLFKTLNISTLYKYFHTRSGSNISALLQI